MHRKSFTLIELLIVIALVAALSVVVLLVLNPASLLQSSRDANRLQDIATLNSAIGLSLADNYGQNIGSANTIYVSLPDPVATSSAGDQCQGLGLPMPPSPYTYHCSASSTAQQTDGTGWIPINFSASTFGSPIATLPKDPTNSSSSRLWYAYATDGAGKYELTTNLESPKYKLGGSNDQIVGTGGSLASVYQRGSKLGLQPLDYGDSTLLGLWTFEEGSSSIAFDYSGRNTTGSWNGTGVHSATGRIGAYSAQFATTTTDYIAGSDSGFPSAASPRTMCAWFKASLTGAFYQDLFSYGVIGQYNAASVLTIFSSGDPNGNFTNAFGATQYGDGVSTRVNNADGFWHHGCATFDGTNWRIYQDGLLKNTKAMATNTVLNVLNFGRAPGTTDYFQGNLDNIRIYSRALSAGEIFALYAGGK